MASVSRGENWVASFRNIGKWYLPMFGRVAMVALPLAWLFGRRVFRAKEGTKVGLRR